ncbi:Retrovirus-related Pol polyprotein from transposon 17.6 [Trichinella patagoniensis]|uniref:RNA-directed DNA polymerase n=1 Tax=Trichinella patagoniensis TaxID=990121 RepID=A0A0V0Z7W9_9BILA|nr:Retrovirus-related Pol polyprotein from transposon 17.6 [Trichinella patagoniensis]
MQVLRSSKLDQNWEGPYQKESQNRRGSNREENDNPHQGSKTCGVSGDPAAGTDNHYRSSETEHRSCLVHRQLDTRGEEAFPKAGKAGADGRTTRRDKRRLFQLRWLGPPPTGLPHKRCRTQRQPTGTQSGGPGNRRVLAMAGLQADDTPRVNGKVKGTRESLLLHTMAVVSVIPESLWHIASGEEPLKSDKGTILHVDGRRMCISGVGMVPLQLGRWRRRACDSSEEHSRPRNLGYDFFRPVADWQAQSMTMTDGSKIKMKRETEKEHLERLGEVLSPLRAVELEVKPGKCQLMRRRHGIGTETEKTAAVQQWPLPRCVREVLQFLGLASYYRRLVRNFAGVANPLHGLTKKVEKWHWDQNEEDSLNLLKRALVSPLILGHPNLDRPFLLDVDASEDADPRGRVAFASRSLSRAKRVYCVTQREMLALVWATLHFRPYLYSRKFMARTDHNSLRLLRNFREPEGQVSYWLERLAEVDFEVIHRLRQKQQNADALLWRCSRRMPTTNNCCASLDNKDEEEERSYRKLTDQEGVRWNVIVISSGGAIVCCLRYTVLVVVVIANKYCIRVLVRMLPTKRELGKRGGRAGIKRTDDTDAEMNPQVNTGTSSFSDDCGSNPVQATNEPARESGSLHTAVYNIPKWIFYLNKIYEGEQ